jgi:hypothetical protein
MLGQDSSVDSNDKGQWFQNHVEDLLTGLVEIVGKKAVCKVTPRIMLQNGEFVVPDFTLPWSSHTK